MCCLSERRKSAYLAGEWLSGVLGFPVLPVPRRPSPPFCLGICGPASLGEKWKLLGGRTYAWALPDLDCWFPPISWDPGCNDDPWVYHVPWVLFQPWLTHRINSLLSFCASGFQSVPRSKSHVLWDFIKGAIQMTSLIKFRSVISCLHPETPSKESIPFSFFGWWSKSYGAELRWPCTEMPWNELPIPLNSVYL